MVPLTVSKKCSSKSVDRGTNWAWLLLDSRVVDVSMAYHPTLVILFSLKPGFFHRLKNAWRFLDTVGAEDPEGIVNCMQKNCTSVQ